MSLPIQRSILSIILGCFVFVFVAGFALAPRPAYAIPVEEVGPVGATQIQKEVRFNIGQVILASAITGLLNAIDMFARKIAYNLAVGLASGCKGGTACASTKAFKQSLISSSYSAAGEFISQLAGPWEGLGLNLCDPRLPDIGLALQLGLAEGLQPPEPKCDFIKTINNWQQFTREVRDPNALLRHVSLAFDTSQTDLGQAQKAQDELRLRIKKRKEESILDRLEGGGIKPQVGIISGNITTPSAVMKRNFEKVAEQGEDQTIKTSDIVAQSLGSGQVWSAIATNVLSTFTNTLLSRMLQLALQGIFADTPNETVDLAKLAGGGPGLRPPTPPGVNPAVASLLTPQIRASTGTTDFLTELAACPSDRSFATQFNCSIDQQFMVAIQSARTGAPLTVQDAVDQGFLDRAKPFGFINATSGREPDYTEGYPYSAMKRLRLLRILPLGWELAAEEIRAQSLTTATLGDVLDGWANPDSNYRGLVDPNWVLKAPVARCSAQVFGASLDGSGTGRQEECVDIQHCLDEDELGNCRAWGYCAREKNNWNFDGDACAPQYASCEEFRPERQGEALYLLENTLDFGACSAENAGCGAYLIEKSAGAGSVLDWDRASPQLYLDRDAPTCSASAAGCQEFISAPQPNLIQNPGFEADEDGDGVPDGWTRLGPGLIWSSDASESFEGAGAIDPAAAVAVGALSQSVALHEGLNYTLSMSAKGEGAARARFQIRGSVGVLEIDESSTTCAVDLATNILILSFVPVTVSGGTPDTYARRSCSFTAPAGAVSAEPVLTSGTDTWIDAVQLEVGVTATDYRVGYGPAPTYEYYRVPPDYLDCTGEITDRPECNQDGSSSQGYAPICRPSEVGCESYTPLQGGPAIPGIATALDHCPAECVGYDTYIKEDSRFEPRFADEGFYRIIPSSAAQCSAQEVGCEEFTNLRTEAREYYSDLRACQIPGPTSKTYFTWEGSEAAGYQLRAWDLKVSNQSYGSDSDDLRIEYASGTAAPPCTNYSVTLGAGGVFEVECADNFGIVGDVNDQAVCDLENTDLTLAQRADCRAFYDEQGNIFHRFVSRTIVSTASCQSFRWTGFPPERLPEVADQSRVDLEQEACAQKNGFWNSATNQCIYLGAPGLSQVCRASVAGCRAFKGNTAGNIETMFSEDFEGSVTLTGRGWATALSTTMNISAEALNVGEHSLRVAGAVSQNHGVQRVFDEPFEQGVTYFVRFLAKGTPDKGIRVFLGDELLGEIEFTPEWRYHELGPLDLRLDSATELRFRRRTTDTFDVADIFYLDDVILRRTQDLLYLVKGSWTTPLSCDNLPEELGGTYSPGAMLGCSVYTDRAGQAQNLKSFSSLCRERSVGCQALSATAESESLFAQEFNTENRGVCRGPEGECRIDRDGDGLLDDSAVCTVEVGQSSCNYDLDLEIDNITVLADAYRFVVANQQFSCAEQERGCSELGRLAPDGTVTTEYRRNDPDRYSTDLCRYEERECQSWRRTDQSAMYFKNPGGASCQWKTNVRIGTQSYSGWFRAEQQPFTSIRADTPQECEGYGDWNRLTGSCVDDQGNTLCTVDDGRRLGGDLCRERQCTRGVGGKWVESQGVEQCVADTPCYGRIVLTLSPGDGAGPAILPSTDSYLISGTTFGVWRNSDSRYQGRTASCPKEQVACTEFLDPTDTTTSSRGEPHYFKDNDRLALRAQECNGQVSRKAGCVLFDNTENPVKTWSAEQSYLQSDSSAGALVAPRPLGGENNTNRILKVARDRQCAEWVQCQSSRWVWDPNLEGGRFKAVCQFLGRCGAFSTSPDPKSLIACGQWIPWPAVDSASVTTESACEALPGAIWHPASGNRPALCEQGVLNTQTYLTRETGYNGREYTGYSVPHIYPIEKLQELTIEEDGESQLVYPMRDENLGIVSCEDSSDCLNVADNSNRDGRCARGICVQTPYGERGTNTADDLATLAPQWACRAYPERTAPFPNTDEINPSGSTPIQTYRNAKVCESDEFGCECEYREITYETLTQFYDLEADNPDKVCVGGRNEGNDCTSDGSICPGGTCTAWSEIRTANGWRGLCLEQDPARVINALGNESLGQDGRQKDPLRRACLSWLPIDQLASAPDIYNQFVQAGYQIPDVGGKFYCLLGGYSRNQTLRSNVHITPPADFLRARTLPEADENVYRYDIAEIEIEIRGLGGNTGAANGIYRFIPGQAHSDQALIGFTGFTGPYDAGHFLAYNFSLPDSSASREWWWFGADDNFNENSDDIEDRNSQNAIQSLIVTPSRFLDTSPDGESGSHALDVVQWDENCENWLAGVSGSGAYDGSYVGLRFDPETQQLTHTRVGACNVNNAGTQGEYDIRVKLYPHCEVIAGIDQEVSAKKSAPDTQRLWEEGGYEIRHDSGTNYNYDTPYSPFGSSPSNESRLSESGHPWFLNHNLLEAPDVAPFAGWPYACPGELQPECSVWVEDPVQPLAAGDPETLNDGIADFQRLFASSDEVYQLQSGGDGYEPSSNNWDVRETLGQGREPQVRRTICDPQGNCTEGDQGLTVNDVYEDGAIVRGANGFLPVALTFYGWANTSHMPLRQIRVNWGDGNITPTSLGRYRNYRAPGQCDGVNFGRTSEACQENYFRFDHVYTCSGPDNSSWTEGAPCPADAQQIYGGCCAFRPAVQLQDNWGFCNGGFGDIDSPAGLSAIDGECNMGPLETLFGEFRPWTPYQGTVIVTPPFVP